MFHQKKIIEKNQSGPGLVLAGYDWSGLFFFFEINLLSSNRRAAPLSVAYLRPRWVHIRLGMRGGDRVCGAAEAPSRTSCTRITKGMWCLHCYVVLMNGVRALERMGAIGLVEPPMLCHACIGTEVRPCRVPWLCG